MGGFVSGLASQLTGGGAIDKIKSKFKNKTSDKKSDSSSSDSSGGGGSGEFESYHRGGLVRKTGLARLKKGERILTKRQQRKLGLRKRMRGK